MGAAQGRLDIRVGSDLASLADHLAGHLGDAHRDVLARDVLVVPTPGIGRWTARRLSRRLGATGRDDGIFANVDVLLFGDLLDRVLSTPDDRPWSLPTMALRALALLADPAAPPSLAALLDERPGALRLPVARSCADLFDQLFRWRPDVADAWLAGRDNDPRAALLRALAEGTDVPPPHRQLTAATQRLRDGAPIDLPGCVHLFGGDGLAGGPRTPELLDALSSSREVHLLLVAPSIRRFERIRAETPAYGATPPNRRAIDEPDVDLLMRSWGTASADAARLLAQVPSRASTQLTYDEASDAEASTLLGALRGLLRDGTAPSRPADGSISFHACVGALRQVEAARDAVLHALRDDPTLEPSDVAFLCADLPRFAPHLQAVLGHPGAAPTLPFVLRDRSLSRAVPLVAAVEGVLRLLAGRFTRSAVLDLCATPGVLRRFGLEPADLDGIVAWMDAAGVHWGIDARERAAAGLPESFEAGTWRRALDRVLAGVALPDAARPDALGLCPVAVGHELEPLGALCELLATLESLRGRCEAPRSLASWCELTREAAAAIVASAPEEARERGRLDELLRELERDGAAIDAEVDFAEFHALFAERAADERDLVVTGAGGLTITSFAPLRNVPFRIVVLLGLDDASISRSASTDGAFGAPRIGDRDPRAELRGALLAAVLAARDQLIVTYDGADVVSNEPVAKATALSELLEASARICDEGQHALVRSHPRHAHGRGDLEVAGPGPFSFDPAALQRAGELAAVPAASCARVRVAPTTVLVADRTSPRELSEFLRSAQRVFLRASLGAMVPNDQPAASDEVPVSLDALETWKLVNELVPMGLVAGGKQLSDEEWQALCDEFAAVPDGPLADLPGRLGTTELHGVSARARQLLAAVDTIQGGPSGERVDIDLAIGTDTLAGRVEVFRDSRIVAWTASSSDDKVRITAAVDLLCLTAFRPERPWVAYSICRGKEVNGVMRSIVPRTLVVPGETPEERLEVALAHLRRLLAIRAVGLREPIPLFFRATMKLREALEHDADASRSTLIEAGERCWNGDFPGSTDRTDASVRYCFDGSFRELCELPWRDGDPTVDDRAEGSRLLAYSLALCDTLRALEPVHDPVPT